MLSEQYLMNYTKNSEMYGSLRNVRKSQKCTKVSEMYGSLRYVLKNSSNQNSSKITEKARKKEGISDRPTDRQTDRPTDRHSDLRSRVHATKKILKARHLFDIFVISGSARLGSNGKRTNSPFHREPCLTTEKQSNYMHYIYLKYEAKLSNFNPFFT